MPIFGREKISLLSNISIYTTEGDKPLGEVLQGIADSYGEDRPDVESITASKETLSDFMDRVLPIWDRERVHDSDIKKLVKWFDILRSKGMTTFTEEEETAEDEA